jgi:hypothetical protein
MPANPPVASPKDISSSKESPLLGIPSLDRRDLMAMSVLAGLIILLFWKVLFTSDMLFFRDIFNTSYPNARFVQEMCRKGELPYWNPYLNWGQAVLANPNALFFYPSTLLIVLLPINLGYPLHFVLHFVIAAIGTYLLARRWDQSRLAGLFAACVFTLSGPVLSLGNFYNMDACAVWLPWALLMTDLALENRSLRPWILLTAIFALQFLAGEPFTMITTFVICVAYALYWRGNFRKPLSKKNFQILFFFAAVGILMIALSAIQFFPSLALLSTSHRGQGMGFKQSTYWSFHPLLLLEVLVPDFFGSAFGTPAPWKVALNFHNAPFLVSYFVGAIPILFALAGWALGRDKRSGFAMLGALSLLILAMGRFTPLYEMFYATIPFLRLVRFPVKLLIPVLLLTAVLAGWGFDAMHVPAADFLRRRKRALIPLFIALGCFLIALIVTFLEPRWLESFASRELEALNSIFILRPAQQLTPEEISGAAHFLLFMLRINLPGLIGFALGGIAWVIAAGRGHAWAWRAVPWIALLGVILLVKVNYNANPTVPKSFYDYRPPVLQHFVNSGGPFRVTYVDHRDPNEKHGLRMQNFLSFDSIPEVAGLPTEAQSLFKEKLLLNWGTMLTGYENGSENDVDGSLPDAFYNFWEYLRDSESNVESYDCLLGRSNVKYLVVRMKTTSTISREISEVFNGSVEPSYLYEDGCFVPRTYAVTSALYSSNVKQTLATLGDPHFDALGQIILAEKPESSVPDESPGPAGNVEIVDRQPNSVTLRANLVRPGFVLLLDRFDPNWHATLDGREVPILRANLMFRAVRCEPGMHEIHFYYRQTGLKAGAVLSLTTLVLLAFLYWRNPRPHKAQLI